MTPPATSVSWLDRDPPEDLVLAQAYWCEMDQFLFHTSTGGYLPCQCGPDRGHHYPGFKDLWMQIKEPTDA
jgi:hypothetical protein